MKRLLILTAAALSFGFASGALANGTANGAAAGAVGGAVVAGPVGAVVGGVGGAVIGHRADKHRYRCHDRHGHRVACERRR